MSGLKKVCKLCGGLTVTANGKTVKYDKDGKVKTKPTFQRYLDSGYEDVIDFKEYIRMCGEQKIKQANKEG